MGGRMCKRGAWLWLRSAGAAAFVLLGAARAGADHDFGDADASFFPVLLGQDGARHVAPTHVFLGAAIDTETNALSSVNATGDDDDGADDEDGIAFATLLVPGNTARLQVTASTNGWLQGWFDFFLAGWSFAGTDAIVDQPVTAGTQLVTFAVPAGAPAGSIAARFRFSTQPGLGITGEAPDGEVEDYLATVTHADFGDAPDGGANAGYATTLANTGAYHVADGALYLGNSIDEESDGQPDAAAAGDDTQDESDDEDGVAGVEELCLGADAQIRVAASAAGLLNAWVDFGQDGAWDAADHVLSAVPLVAGTNQLAFMVPTNALQGHTYARFRFASVNDSSPQGPAPDGEVEDYRVHVAEFDFGDALGEGPYPTVLEQNGARHTIVSGVHLGALIDGEPDAAAGSDGLGDDQTGLDDEDGMALPEAVYRGESYPVVVTASTNGILEGWFDFDRNGTWGEATEHVWEAVAMLPGTNLLMLDVPVDANPGETFGRVRFSTVGGIGVDGAAPDGEVEDMPLTVHPGGFDFGDAPPGNGHATTLAENGARHRLADDVWLGTGVDADTNGQPSPDALGDDADAGGDDEDGVDFVTPLVPGRAAQVYMTASTTGYLQAWIDVDPGGWGAPEARIVSNVVVNAGQQAVPFAMPTNAQHGTRFMRFRLGTEPNLEVTGQASDGEVEDYAVTVTALDFGDAPQGLNANFPTTLALDGARHVVTGGVYLGTSVDPDLDGQASTNAAGDDADALGDDEDGIVLPSPLRAGESYFFDVTVSAAGYLQGWIDFDQDGEWEAGPERVCENRYLPTDGTFAVPLSVPANSDLGVTFARFRFSTEPDLVATGRAGDGEVEDQLVIVEDAERDYGDAPPGVGYRTLHADNGARHRVVGGIRMGAALDVDPDGQPSADAQGDDTDADGDDEDGVAASGLWLRGGTNQLAVSVTSAGYLQAWMDFNGNGDWAGAGEQVLSNRFVAAGTTLVAVVVSPGAVQDIVTRVRYCTVPDVGLTGDAPNGEVEDLRIAIDQFDCGDAPVMGGAQYPVLIAADGAYHVLGSGVQLGALVDGDPDGQPAFDARGDDTDGDGADEDGVQWLNALRPGGVAVVRVSASATGYLQGWVDFGADGDWNAPGDRVFNNQALGAGATVLAFAVPANAAVTNTFARFRFSTAMGVGVGGGASDGEVEDYAVRVAGVFAGAPSGGPCATWFQRPNRTYGIDVQSWQSPSLGPTNGRVVRGADDWISDGRQVMGCRWWGSYVNWNGNPLAPPAASRPGSFRITLYADGTGTNAPFAPEPGIEVTNATVTLLGFGNTNAVPGQATERLYATNDLAAFSTPGDYEYEYLYEAFFTNAWPVVAGRRMWFGVEAVNGAVPTYRWGWCVAYPHEGLGQPAALRKSSDPGWIAMTYPPNVFPWSTATNHPDLGQPVELAFELFSDDCPRRARTWVRTVDAVTPAAELSWLRSGDGAGAVVVRADNLVADGRPAAGVVWSGGYRGWMETTPGSVTNPVAMPGGNARPLGFLLELRAGGSGCALGAVVTNCFVPIAKCGERYEASWPQPWRGVGHYLHAYAYEADLLDPGVAGQAWALTAGSNYWLSVQAVFAAAFSPGGGTHQGWGWRTSIEEDACTSLVAINPAGPWSVAGRSDAPFVEQGEPFDLVFDLQTAAPGLSPLYEQPEILALDVLTNGMVRVTALGDLGSGVQVLQASSNMADNVWVDLETNDLPRAWPYTNRWEDARPAGNKAGLRIQQR